MQFGAAGRLLLACLIIVSAIELRGAAEKRGVLLKRRDCPGASPTFNPCWVPSPAPGLPEGYIPKRLPGEDPFIVSMRVEVTGGPDNIAVAKKIAHLINTPYTEPARVMALSTARVPDETFPPVPCCGSTTPPPAWVAAGTGAPCPGPGPHPGPGPSPAPMLTFTTTFSAAPAPFPFHPFPGPAPALGAPAPAPVPGAPEATPTLDPNWARWQRTRESSIVMARRAYEIAELNKNTFNKLSEALEAGQRAREEAWVFPPTQPPPKVAAPQAVNAPPSVGKLVYDALMNTPPPVQTTPPPLMTTTTFLATTLAPITTVWERGNR